MRSFVVVLLLVVASRCSAQRGAGIATFNGTRTTLSFVRAYFDAPSARQLMAIVVFRGRGEWTSDEVSPSRRKTLEDAVRVLTHGGDSEAFGGVVTTHASGLIAYDRQQRLVVAAGVIYPLPRGDSTLIVLVDAVDTAAPLAQRFVVPLPRDYPATPAQGAEIPAAWWTLVRTHFPLRVFVERALLP